MGQFTRRCFAPDSSNGLQVTGHTSWVHFWSGGSWSLQDVVRVSVRVWRQLRSTTEPIDPLRRVSQGTSGRPSISREKLVCKVEWRWVQNERSVIKLSILSSLAIRNSNGILKQFPFGIFSCLFAFYVKYCEALDLLAIHFIVTLNCIELVIGDVRCGLGVNCVN